MINYIEKNIAKFIISNEEITAELAAEFVGVMTFLEDLDEIDTVEIRLNSPGGSVLAGFSMYSAIKSSSKNTVTINEGVCASICSVLFLAGQTRIAFDYSTFMIHNAHGGGENALEAINESIQVIYQPFLGDESIQLMEDETWMNAKTMLERNIATEITITKDMNKIIKQILALTNKLVESKTEKEDTKMESKLLNEAEVETEEIQSEITEEEVIESEVEVEAEAVEDNSEVEAEEETESEEEVSETEEVVEEEIEEVVNEVSLDELVEQITKLQEENAELLTELNNKKDEEVKASKLEILNKAGIKDVDNWLDLPLEKVLELTKTVNKKSVTINTDAKKEYKLAEMNDTEKLELASNDLELYRELIKKSK